MIVWKFQPRVAGWVWLKLFVFEFVSMFMTGAGLAGGWLLVHALLVG